jgi:DNA replication protein DnaC
MTSPVSSDDRVGRIVPPRFRSRTLDNFEARSPSAVRALEAARAVVEHGASLVLSGPPGVGKTHLAAGIVRAVAEAGERRYLASLPTGGTERWPAPPPDPVWWNVAAAIVAMRAEFDGHDRRTSQHLLAAASAPGLVVLDDLGRERMTDWTAEVIYVVINGRYERQLPTVVTTNLTLRSLAETPYWPAISRLAEDGYLVTIEGPDERLARRR